MPKFRKIPVVIEAALWDPDEQGANRNPWPPEWAFAKDGPEAWRTTNERVGPTTWDLIIPTLEGDHRADPGDWIIRGVKGEFYPCKPDIFTKTYEPA